MSKNKKDIENLPAVKGEIENLAAPSPSGFDISSETADPKIRKKIAIVLKNFSHGTSYSPAQMVRCTRAWRESQVVRDPSEIDFLLSINAPIEVFYRDA